MNVYDFDKTIYDGDSTVDFYLYCLRLRPFIILRFPLLTAVKYACSKKYKQQFKERFYGFLRWIPDIDRRTELFWQTHIHGIKQFYRDIQQPDDVIISASPEFLLEPVCKMLGIQTLMASVVDKNTGRYSGINCWGDEKVRRFYEKFGKSARIDCFYSDSY